MEHVLDAHLFCSERKRFSRYRGHVELEAPGGDHRAVAPKFVFIITHRRYPVVLGPRAYPHQ